MLFIVLLSFLAGRTAALHLPRRVGRHEDGKNRFRCKRRKYGNDSLRHRRDEQQRRSRTENSPPHSLRRLFLFIVFFFAISLGERFYSSFHSFSMTKTNKKTSDKIRSGVDLILGVSGYFRCVMYRLEAKTRLEAALLFVFSRFSCKLRISNDFFLLFIYRSEV